MADSRQDLLEKLAVRVADRTGLDLDAARTAVDEALVHRGEHLLVVRAEVAAMAEEMARPLKAAYRSVSDVLRRACAAATPVAVADERVAAEARQGIRDHERGLRMAAHHPDLAALDRLLDAFYEQP